MNRPSVLLISMPWYTHRLPSIQLGTLKAILDRHEIASECRSHYLTFLDFLSVQTEAFQLSLDEYDAISELYHGVGLGDWIFGVPPFRDLDAARDERYLHYLQRQAVPEDVIRKAFQLRSMAPIFLQHCLADILQAGPKIVGFSSMFSQNVASLCLAQMLKAADPSLKVVFGGANCQGEMGAVLLHNYTFVDAVVMGEAEHVFPSLVNDWLENRNVAAKPGICYREKGEEHVREKSEAEFVSMDDVPLPDYDEYFERLGNHRLRQSIDPLVLLPVESARGCWWGEKSHCTFCGLNGATMAFRSKQAERFYDELLELARRYHRLDFKAVDNILNMRFFKDFWPRVRGARNDWKFYYEVKANLKKSDLRMMRDAGLRDIQPGIESFSTPILKLMRKGVTALENVRLLKWCAQLGIDVFWNLIYAIPGEPIEEYPRMADMMRHLVHFKPPQFLRLNIDRFSPYHHDPAAHGLEITGASSSYEHIYDLEPDQLTKLAYCFQGRYLDGRDPESYVASCRRAVEDWNRCWPQSYGTLSYRRGPGFLIISDKRPNHPHCERTLEAAAAAAYLACDGGASLSNIWRQIESAGLDDDTERAAIKGLLDELTSAGWMLEENGRYLSLAMRANANEIIAELEATIEGHVPEDQEVDINRERSNDTVQLPLVGRQL